MLDDWWLMVGECWLLIGGWWWMVIGGLIGGRWASIGGWSLLCDWWLTIDGRCCSLLIAGRWVVVGGWWVMVEEWRSMVDDLVIDDWSTLDDGWLVGHGRSVVTADWWSMIEGWQILLVLTFCVVSLAASGWCPLVERAVHARGMGLASVLINGKCGVHWLRWAARKPCNWAIIRFCCCYRCCCYIVQKHYFPFASGLMYLCSSRPVVVVVCWSVSSAAAFFLS